MKYLVLMEVGKKQSYIFKSNKLKENKGASLIIQYVTEDLPKEKMKIFKGEEVMRGGGKSLYSFSDEQDSLDFIKSISEEIVKRFSGLDIYFVKDIFDENIHNFSEKIEELYIKLGNKKSLKKNTGNQVSFGIEKICRSTGLPASYYDKDEVISEEINIKRRFADSSKVNSIIKGRDNKFPKEFDEITEDDNSYIAVIHIDGNSMGDKFVKLSQYYKDLINKDKKYNKVYLQEINKLSKEIDDVYKNAFNKIIDESIEEDKATIRPIILAGDDVTFVCKAEDGIRLARIFIEEINKSEVNIGNKLIKLNAAAGIVFFKSHYPFSRAYDLAEELCSNCKGFIKEKNEDASMIDWHILQGEISSSIYEIRKNQYVTEDNLELTMRPIFINKDSEFNSFDNFKWSVDFIKDSKVSRSKIKDLRNEYTKGIQATESFITYYKLKESFDWFNKSSCEYGILNNTAVFFDAIEIMDLVKEV